MTGMLIQSSIRYHARHPGMLALSVLGIAVGVALVVGIDAANTSAREGFRLSAEAVAGTATHSIYGPGETLDEEVYVNLRLAGFRTIAPIIEGYVRMEDGSRVQVLGIDPFVDAVVRPARPESGPSATRWIGEPNASLVSSQLASDQALVEGDSLRVTSEGRTVSLVVGGILRGDNGAGSSRLLVVDISTAQQVVGRPGALSRIDAVLSPEQERSLQNRLPAGARLESSASRTTTLSQMTKAFDTNLTALSYLALVVGVFLIYNVVSFSVVQRRAIWGRLRALGVSVSSLERLVIGEALVLGLVGSLVGLLFGLGLSGVLTQLVTRAINDLYFVVSVTSVELPAFALLKGLLLGTGSAALVALGPARSAARMSAISVMRRSDVEASFQARIPALTFAATLLAVLGVLLLRLEGGIALAYGGLLSIVAAFALAVPAVVAACARLFGWIAARWGGPIAQMAAGSLRSQMSRTAVATAALAVAVAAAVGVGVMVESFRGTVEVWLGYALQADVYVQPPALVARRGGAVMDPGLVREIRSLPQVRESYGVRRVTTASRWGSIDLVAIEHGPSSWETYRFKESVVDAPWQAFKEGSVFVSEPFSMRFGVQAGETLELTTAGGERVFNIASVYYDYGSDLGAVLMDRDVFADAYKDTMLAGLALFLDPSANRREVASDIERRSAPVQELNARSNADLKAASLDIFDRTFAVTWVLRILAVVVAIIGIVSALGALQLERSWEFGVLRAIGMLPGELRTLVIAQSAMMGWIAGLLSVPLGLVLAYALVFVINVRSFGWTLQFDLSPGLLLQAIAVAVISAVLAALIPARTVSSTRVSDMLRKG